MPALIAPIAGFVLGTLFAWLSRPELAGAPSGTASRGLMASLWFGALIHAPAAGYLLAFYPDWSFSYWFAPKRTGAAPLLGLLLLDAASPAAGFALAARWAAHHRPIPLLRLVGGPTLIAAALILSQSRRIRTLGTYAEFHGDFGTESIAGSPLGYALLWLSVTVLGAALWTARYLRIRAALRRSN